MYVLLDIEWVTEPSETAKLRHSAEFIFWEWRCWRWTDLLQIVVSVVFTRFMSLFSRFALKPMQAAAGLEK